MNTLLLIRHGAVDSPIGPEGPLIYGPEQPLNTQGRHQIIRLGQQLVNEQTIPEIIYSSAFTRARESAQLLHETLPNHPPVVIRETLSGTYAPGWYLRPESEAQNVHDLFADNPYNPDAKGETIEHAYQRATREYEDIQSAHPGKTVAIVSHFEIIGLLRHYIDTRDQAPTMSPSIEKGEAILYQFSPEGNVLKEQIISPERQYVHPERR